MNVIESAVFSGVLRWQPNHAAILRESSEGAIAGSFIEKVVVV